MVKAYLGIGSNLGNRRAHLAQARAQLAQTAGITLLRSSPLYTTDPVGGPADQGAYLNGVLEVETTLSPEALLQRCQALELAAGRTRDVRNAPRTLDIDLLLYGEICRDDPQLTLPHPRLHERLFVLAPLYDLAMELRHPRLGVSCRLLRDQLPAHGVALTLKEW